MPPRVHNYHFAEQQLADAIDRIRAGESLTNVARSFGCTDAGYTLRAKLKERMGDAAYDEMIAKKSGRYHKAGEPRGPGAPRALSDEQVLAVAERIRVGSSVLVEAKRLNVYHSTLRKTMRKVLGHQGYDEVMEWSQQLRDRPTKRRHS